MEKNLDYKGRWRNKVVAFRVSAEEKELIDTQVILERVKRYVGVDKVQGIIDSMKEVERLNEVQRQLQKNYNKSMGR